MRIEVAVSDGSGRMHEAPIVQTEKNEGALSVELFDLEMKPMGWTYYANGWWRHVELVESPSQEAIDVMTAHNEKLEEERRAAFPRWGRNR